MKTVSANPNRYQIEKAVVSIQKRWTRSEAHKRLEISKARQQWLLNVLLHASTTVVA